MALGIEGQTLRDVLRRRNGEPMTPRAALDLLRPVLKALGAAHDQQIAHRDVKPANTVLVDAERNNPRQVLLMDFGVAKLMEDGEAAAGDAVKTRSEFSTSTKRRPSRR